MEITVITRKNKKQKTGDKFFFFLITEMRSLQNHNGSTIHKNMLMLHLEVLQKLRFSELTK